MYSTSKWQNDTSTMAGIDIYSKIINGSEVLITNMHQGSIRSAEECIRSLGDRAYPPPNDGVLYCNATFDTVLCWPVTPAGTVQYLQCPPLRGLDTSKFSFRKCGPGGRWEGKIPGDYSDPKGYTNYTACYTKEAMEAFMKFFANKSSAQRKMMKDIAAGTRTMEVVGLSLSLVTSLISLFIFSYFRSLRCHRTRIHLNLFVAIIVQTIIRLMLYVDQYVARTRGGEIGGTSMGNSETIFDTPVFCELFYALLEYTKTVQFMWMLIEGLFLHNMIAVSVFSARPNYLIFYALGWGTPVPFTVAWVITMTYTQNKAKCWFPYYFMSYYWIIETPRVVVIAVNLFFLLNIIRVLVTKLRQSQSNVDQVTKVRKAVKAAIVLLPLLGITNFVVMTDAPADDLVKFGIWCYGTNFLVSFQGFIISLLYCFLNGEVQDILKRHFCTSKTMRLESSLSSIKFYPPPQKDKVQLTLRKHWKRYRQGNVIASNFRRLSRSFSVFTSITEVTNNNGTQRRSSSVPVTNGNAVPLLREIIALQESKL